eukprot:NODE_1375_length_1532_cov_30.358007_g1302_i0.p1 GENE.NODE_1375_length_1532_cov_30.358007_g1302_i0~~NODE_1375_length_1532_cov_30.358007_g1302_i0.p1  ORF type:complete len:494 (-),score=129.93 NODE_1375_length_1532_cov_30.358007_g1302_i0:51-1532(-)
MQALRLFGCSLRRITTAGTGQGKGPDVGKDQLLDRILAQSRKTPPKQPSKEKVESVKSVLRELKLEHHHGALQRQHGVQSLFHLFRLPERTIAQCMDPDEAAKLTTFLRKKEWELTLNMTGCSSSERQRLLEAGMDSLQDLQDLPKWQHILPTIYQQNLLSACRWYPVLLTSLGKQWAPLTLELPRQLPVAVGLWLESIGSCDPTPLVAALRKLATHLHRIDLHPTTHTHVPFADRVAEATQLLSLCFPGAVSMANHLAGLTEQRLANVLIGATRVESETISPYIQFRPIALNQKRPSAPWMSIPAPLLDAWQVMFPQCADALQKERTRMAEAPDSSKAQLRSKILETLKSEVELNQLISVDSSAIEEAIQSFTTTKKLPTAKLPKELQETIKQMQADYLREQRRERSKARSKYRQFRNALSCVSNELLYSCQPVELTPFFDKPFPARQQHWWALRRMFALPFPELHSTRGVRNLPKYRPMVPARDLDLDRTF